MFCKVVLIMQCLVTTTYVVLALALTLTLALRAAAFTVAV